MSRFAGAFWALPGFFFLAASLKAEVVGFESPTYAVNRPLEGVDGWVRSLSADGDSTQFMVIPDVSSTGNSGGVVEVHTAVTYTLSRPFRPVSQAIDLKWRWKIENAASIHFCLGLGPQDVTTNLPFQICLYPKSGNGNPGNPSSSTNQMNYIGSGGNTLYKEVTFATDVWHYMRLHVDQTAGTWSLMGSETAARDNETIVLDTTTLPIAMRSGGSTGSKVKALGQLFLKSEGDKNSSALLIDNFEWQRADTKLWVGTNLDSAWNTPTNWNPTGIPDSTDIVVFASAKKKGCALTNSVTVQSIVMQEGYAGTLSFGDYSMTVLGSADFSGGKFKTNRGVIRFSGGDVQVLTPSVLKAILPPIIHDGPNALQLSSQPLYTMGLTQSAGVFDFNGFDLGVTGELVVQNGNAKSFKNLGGRTLTVTGSANLQGSASQILALDPPSAWSLNVGGTLTATYASLANSNANLTVSKGKASRSQDKGNNQNWVFKNAPVFVDGPDSITVILSQIAEVAVHVTDTVGVKYQWYRDGLLLPIETDSRLQLTGLAMANSGTKVICIAENSEGLDTSKATRIVLSFPAPTPDTTTREINGTLSLGFKSKVNNAAIYVSINEAPFVKIPGIEKVLISGDSVVVRTYAVWNVDTSSTATYVFYSTTNPQAMAPSASPVGTDFKGSVQVTLANAKNLPIYYTDDGSVPTSLSKPYNQILTLAKTTQISAIAVGTGYRASAVMRELYLDTTSNADLKAPQASAPGGVIPKENLITFTAGSGQQIWWRYRGQAWKLYSNTGVAVPSDGIVEAVAIQGSSRSSILRLEYIDGTPIADKPSQIFRDSIRVTLTAPDGWVIYASVTGEIDTAKDAYTKPFVLDTTAVLNAIAWYNGVASASMQRIYQLDALTPVATPGEGLLARGDTVRLKSGSAKAAIFYNLNGNVPMPGDWTRYASANPITVTTSLILKAVSVTGSGRNQLISPVMEASYDIKPETELLTLLPGQDAIFQNALQFHLGNTATASAQVRAALLPNGVYGFDSVKTVFNATGIKAGSALTLANADTTLKDINLWYIAMGTTKPTRMQAKTPITLKGDGIYFQGRDTLSPTLVFSGESFNPEGFTVATFTLDDNTAAIDYQVWRTDRPDSVLKVSAAATEFILKLNLKNPPTSIQTLGVRLCTQDGSQTNATCLPKIAGNWLSLGQKTKGFTTVDIWNVGVDKIVKWDLIGLPIRTDTAMTLATLRKANSRDDLVLASYDITKKDSIKWLVENDELQPGKAYWAASAEPLKNMSFGPGVLQSSGENAFKITLKPGWNALASKQLESVLWPAKRSDAAAYRRSRLRGLWKVDLTKEDGWDTTDAFLPWHGYYTYWKGNTDTTINLDAVQAVAAKQAGQQSSSDWIIRLHANGKDLELGAFDGASEALSFEDEMALPSRRRNSTSLVSLREKQSLGADYLPKSTGALLTWSVQWRNGVSAGSVAPKTQSAGNSNTKSTWGDLQVTQSDLPSDFSLVAISSRRHISFDLLSGKGIAAPPEGYQDTLRILAGPKLAVAAEVAKLPAAPNRENSAWGPQGRLALDLPGNRHVTLEIFDSFGRQLGKSDSWLPSGSYALAIPQKRQMAAGPTWLRIRLAGEGPAVQTVLLIPATHKNP